MHCTTCGVETKQIATKTTSRGAGGATKCHRLACGHAWHVTASTAGDPSTDGAATPCGCREIVIVNDLLVAGHRLAIEKDELREEDLRAWSAQVLEALDGIPAESGSQSLSRIATTATKSAMSSTSKKVRDLNALLVRAVTAVS